VPDPAEEDAQSEASERELRGREEWNEAMAAEVGERREFHPALFASL
jgi:hypothetical protein